MLYDNLTVNEKGHLAIGGLDTAELAAEFGTPLYILDENVIRRNCRTYVNAMHECFGPAVCSALREQGAVLQGYLSAGAV